jgi:hypothetical protein
MDLVLAFADRAISGDGNDDIGQFVITGRFDEANCECYWTKTYIGAHDVYYRGFREGKGIWGVWELPDESGGFHIWPLGQEEGERDHESAEEPAPVEAVAVAVLPGSMTPATAVVGLRNIKARLTSSHLHQRSNPREMCLRSLTSGTKPS